MSEVLLVFGYVIENEYGTAGGARLSDGYRLWFLDSEPDDLAETVDKLLVGEPEELVGRTVRMDVEIVGGKPAHLPLVLLPGRTVEGVTSFEPAQVAIEFRRDVVKFVEHR